MRVLGIAEGQEAHLGSAAVRPPVGDLEEGQQPLWASDISFVK